jgi:predicted nucleic acid-binding protein
VKKRTGRRVVEFVLDCSVTMAWYFKDEADPYSREVRKALGGARAVVPGLWPLEVANILVLAERRKRSGEAETSKWLSLLRLLPIRVDDETTARAWSDILHIARSHELTAYDAAYLELALRLGLPLASLDDKLKAAAADAGIPQFQP